MSKRTREILKLAARQVQIVENVNIEIIDYQPSLSEDNDPHLLNQFDVMESNMLYTMDIDKKTEEIYTETEITGMTYCDTLEVIDLEKDNCNEIEVPYAEKTDRQNIEGAMDTEDAGWHEVDGGTSLNSDISDDSDYITPKLVTYSGSDSNCSDEMPIKNKKRRKNFQVDKSTWFSEMNRKRRESGKRYYGRTKINGKWTYDIERKPRKLKERCKFKYKNGSMKCSQITEGQRKNISDYFWSLTWGEKKVFVDSTVKSDFIKRPRKVPDQSRRNHTFKYFSKIGDQELECVEQCP
ncbi:unnamed protein product [Brassicogethes aeneus]|uniref:Uncharacterized protein n=1 Tax=Brassicogethes aeneus TaxID=1431903 RepID=A0A9P0ATP1_BRAAE|nr:unnamed protein product [Brassicogethes aeneus]